MALRQESGGFIDKLRTAQKNNIREHVKIVAAAAMASPEKITRPDTLSTVLDMVNMKECESVRQQQGTVGESTVESP